MLLEITCPYCKKLINVDVGIKKQYQCPICNQMVLQKVIVPHQSKAQQGDYFVDIPYDLPSETVDDIIAKKKVDDRVRLLKDRKFKNYTGLTDKQHTPFTLRLDVLSIHCACDENELALGSRKLAGPVYEQFMKVCDEQTRLVYHQIEQQIEQNIKIDAEINKVLEIWNVGLQEEAVDYAMQMTQKYPNKTLAHARLVYAKYYYYSTTYSTITIGKDTVSDGQTAWALVYLLHRDELLADIARMEQAPDYNLVLGDYLRTGSLHGYMQDAWMKHVMDFVPNLKNPYTYKKYVTGYALKYIKQQEKLAKKEKKGR